MDPDVPRRPGPRDPPAAVAVYCVRGGVVAFIESGDLAAPLRTDPGDAGPRGRHQVDDTSAGRTHAERHRTGHAPAPDVPLGLVADLHPTTYELRLGILQSKAEQKGLSGPAEGDGVSRP